MLYVYLDFLASILDRQDFMVGLKSLAVSVN